MNAAMTVSADKLNAEKDKDSTKDYRFVLSKLIASDDKIVAASWSVTPAGGVTVMQDLVEDDAVTVTVSGGAERTWYALRCSWVSDAGVADDFVFRLFVKEDAENVSPIGTDLFPNRFTAVAALRSEYSAQLSSYVDLSKISDDDLFAKLRAAESDASRQLRVFFAPTVVIPEGAPQSEIDALEAAGTRFVQEPAYDYEPEFFMGESWGYIVVNHRPLVSVQSIKFAYPDPTSQVWEVPVSWVRTDKQFGHIRLVPAAQSFSAPLSAFVMQALGGGRTIPFMIQVRYTAGLVNPAREYPELIDLVKKMAALRILQSAFLPQSGSISADGLSQSASVDVEKWHDGIVDKLGELRDAIHGIRMMVV